MKKNQYIFYLMSLFEGMVFYTSISTLYRQAAGLSIFQISIIESISLVVCLLLEMPWGVIADRIGYRITIILSAFFYLISKIIFWQASSFSAFLLERLVLSIAVSGMSGCDMGMLYLSCEKKDSQKAFSLCTNMQLSGMLVAALVYSLLLSHRDYRVSSFLTIISYLIVFILSLGLTEVKEPHQANSSLESPHSTSKEFFNLLASLFHDKKQLGFLIGVGLLSETHQTITVFLGQLQDKACGLNEEYFGYLLIFITLSGMLGIFSSRLTHFLGRKHFIFLLFFIATSACVILALTQNALLAIFAIVILKIAFSLFEPLQLQIQNETVVSTNRATMLSINAVFLEGIGVITNVLFGRISDIHLSYAMMLGAIFCLISGFLVKRFLIS